MSRESLWKALLTLGVAILVLWCSGACASRPSQRALWGCFAADVMTTYALVESEGNPALDASGDAWPVVKGGVTFALSKKAGEGWQWAGAGVQCAAAGWNLIR